MTLNIRVIPLMLAGAAAACSGPRESPSPAASPASPAVIEQAPPASSPAALAAGLTAQLSPTQGSTVRGSVTFEPVGGGVRVTAHVEGLPPGDHGFHLHEVGDCSAPDASSAGAHWNPTSQPHGGPDSAQHHAGDLGNVTADASGMAHMERVVQWLSLDGAQSPRGRAVLVHAQADDLKSQPAGNAGARLSCGVVGGGTGAASPEGTQGPRDPSD